jgi:hypothetical protein
VTTTLIDIPTFRAWAGAGADSVPDVLVQLCLDEAESALVADVRAPVATITADPDAAVIARGDVLRRTANLLARRNSPEGVAGVGDDGLITVPSGDPGSPAAVRRIQRILRIERVVAR